ncbi:MAG: ASKHA domain-containing protein [Flexilinea sp.]
MNKLSQNEDFFQVDFEPVGLRTTINRDQTLLSASQLAGIQLVAFCGGRGGCRACKVRLLEGILTNVTSIEEKWLKPKEIESNIRLACQAYPKSDLKIYIPPESLSTQQLIQLEGKSESVFLNDCVIRVIDLELAEPTMTDLRADTTRIKDALSEKGIESPKINNYALRTISDELREKKWNFRAVIRKNELIAVFPKDQKVFGLAVDIGTTKIASYLINLDNGQTVARKGMMNPQIGFGEDIISRIAYTDENPDGRDILQKRLIDTINVLIQEFCEENGLISDQIVEAVVVCNTAIHHLFINLPVHQLGLYPFIPAVSESLNLSAHLLGLKILRSAYVYLPINIAGYVGADHVSMLIGSRTFNSSKTRIALDIGTNTEISLLNNGRLFCCSCASGPAFEGAHIHNGMRASNGAIERVQITGQELRYQTIGNQPATGICGSGILDIVASLKSSGAINKHGNFCRDFPNVRPADRSFEYVLVPEDQTASGNAITINRSDINEVILAKSAIRTGIEILLIESELQLEDIDEFIVAGAFGTYLNIESAVAIGMFPDLPLEKFSQIGNAAGTGARDLLLSETYRNESEALVFRMQYVELACHPSFKKILIQSMPL